MVWLRRVVFWGQWVAAILLPLWLFAAPGAFNPGWMALLAFFTGPVVFTVILLCAIVTTTARPVRTSRTAPPWFSVFSLAFWTSILLWGAATEGVGDGMPYTPLLAGWGAGEPVYQAISGLSLCSALLCGALMLAAAVTERGSRAPSVRVVVAPSVPLAERRRLQADADAASVRVEDDTR